VIRRRRRTALVQQLGLAEGAAWGQGRHRQAGSLGGEFRGVGVHVGQDVGDDGAEARRLAQALGEPVALLDDGAAPAAAVEVPPALGELR
jgi:hypothetical protein